MMSLDMQRRTQIIEAAVHEIGVAGSLNVPVGRIARRAGVSSGLPFHYFGDKDRLFLAAMRHILSIYGRDVRRALEQTDTPRERLDALIRTSFGTAHFSDEVIAAWLNFYVLARSSPDARRLLAVYHRRLHSNLTHALRPLAGDRAAGVAERIAGLIDGLYLRSAIDPQALHDAAAMDHVFAALDTEIGDDG